MKADIIFRFLRDIAIHNDREWFQANRGEWDEAKAAFEDFLSVVIGRIALFDDSVAHLQPKDCMYRIYRDIRFSADKSPYKRHIGGYINSCGKKSAHSGYYIHLEPGSCMLCSGSIYVTGKMLKAIRRSIYDNMDEYREIVESKDFKQYFSTIGFEHLKTAPIGYPKDYPYIDYLKCKDYAVCLPVTDDFFSAPNLYAKLDDIFKQMKRFNDFINETIDEMEIQ
jgi:uncharacterized protein (TIGR02453 family)